MNTGTTHSASPGPIQVVTAPAEHPTDPAARRVRAGIRRAMGSPESIVISFEYCDQKGRRTRRVASPIRFAGENSFLALCLSREEPRRFELDRCKDVRIVPAHLFQMPVPLVDVADAPA